MPSDVTVRGWALEDREGFFSQYARAREIGYPRMADELVNVADTVGGDVQRDRLRVDTRKWLLSKALPKVFGDKLQLGGDGGEPIKHEHAAAADLAALSTQWPKGRRANDVARQLGGARGPGTRRHG